MKKLVICLGLVTILVPALHSQPLDQDPLINYYFNKEEINDLQSIIYFFDRHVTQDCDQGVPACLSAYAEALADTMIATQEIPDIFDDTLLTSMLDSLSPKLFSEIWHYASRKKEISLDSTYHFWEMNYHLDGRYFKYLSASSYITDTTLKYYVEPAEATRDMSPSMVTYPLLNHHQYDLNNERNRLIFAIHCITLNGHQMPQFDREVLRIKNTNLSPIQVEMGAYPAENYKNNRASAFHANLLPEQSFTLNFDGLYFSEENIDLSIVQSRFNQEGFQLLVYKPIRDSSKDTLLTKRFTVQELIDQSPVITIP